MAEWFRKNLIMVVINAIITIVLSVIGFSVSRVVAEMDRKPDRVEVNEKFETARAEREVIKTRVDGIEKSTDEKFDLILENLSALRQDLRLKQDKK